MTELFNKDNAIEGIESLKQYFKDIGMNTNLLSLKLNKPLDIQYMANQFKNKSIKDFIDIDYNAFIEIFNLAR